MSIPPQIRASRLLNSKGWDTCIDAKLLRATDPWQDTPEFRSHGHTLRHLFEEMHMDAVLCVEKYPTVCILNANAKNTTEVGNIRHQLWNLGSTTLLVVESNNSVQVYSTLVKPSQQDPTGTSAQIGEETIQNLEAVELALRLRQLIRRVETGAIYREYKSLFDPKAAVDRYLLDNLKAARDLICPQPTKKGYQHTHALIGRFLFSCYLLDRGIIGPPYLKKKGLPEATDVLKLLNATSHRAEMLVKLFNALHHDFNGSLFGEPFLEGDLQEREVDYLHRLLTGEDLRSNQLSLFKLYDFSYIPVELISSIYEEFLGAEAEAETKARPSRRNQLRNNSQRMQGAYYTPPRLAELTVDIATEGWDTLLDKKCLDPACGSGIFLVILFIRMAEEWRRRNHDASTSERYTGLMSLLEKNLHGIDTQLTACLVTCFSLYLAFLDQMEPKEIMELRYALERDTHKKLLPRILWERERPRPRDRHFATVREIDFFTLKAEPEFNLVIGNPPWVSRKPAPSAEAWLFSVANPYAGQIDWNEHQKNPKPKQTAILFPNKELACAFMWKAGLHLLPNGRVCQVLPSRVLLSNNIDSFQIAWLNQHRLESVWFLADYSFILFPSAACPCFIGRYHLRGKEESLGNFEFISPKVDWIDPRQALIPVLPEDQKVISEADIIAGAESKAVTAAWKKHHWGTPRDIRLIDRLMRLPKLNDLAARPPRMKRDDKGNRESQNKKRWWKGQGFQPASEIVDEQDSTYDEETKSRKAWKAWWNSEHLFYAADTETEGIILNRSHCEPYGKHSEKLRRTIAPELTRPPLVLVNKGFSKVCLSKMEDPVVFQHAVQSIAGPVEDENLLHFLAAYLDSQLAKYLVFHSAVNLATERDEVHLEEIMSLPFPLPEQTKDPIASQSLIDSCAKVIKEWHEELESSPKKTDDLARLARCRLMKFVSEYFLLSEWEQKLVSDTVNIFWPSSTPGSYDSKKLYTVLPTSREDRKAYAETLTKTFRSWSRTKKHLWAEGFISPRSNLSMITFGVGEHPKAYVESDMEERIEEILSRIREATAHDDATVFYRLRGFAFYEPDRVHILKPLNRRHWTHTAALNDADEIISRMMEEGGWGA